MKNNTSIMSRLRTMMFMQFFVWGAWYTSIAVYMSEVGMGDLTHWPYTVNPIAAVIAPFFIGLIADKYFATQKVLGLLHIAGAVFLFLAPSTIENPTVFIIILLIYNLCYMPTLGLSNSIAFRNIDDQEKQFPSIRVFGTIGWIVAGLFISFVLGGALGITAEKTALPLYTAAVASALLGLYSFTLPDTQPESSGKQISFKEISGLSVVKDLASPAFFVFMLASFLICIPLAAYYNFTQLFLSAMNVENIAGIQTLGQFSEIIFMLLMPLFFRHLGVKWMLVVGMFAWVLRYALFAISAPDSVMWMIMLGIALHGICYDFFFVTGQIYIDKQCTDKNRGQAQGLLVLVTYGIGMLVGAQVAGMIYNRFLDGQAALTTDNWASFWWLPASFAAGIALLFILAFKEKNTKNASQAEAL
ncbi:MFS transporter [Vibrio mangrovi]|uniref:MFS transporter n=1 Tax=Vibrio mangrovi TaxID=474394 RepID=A0A1Y6ISJ3_9VIBR|nr:MFS transporter [Vibrio mangrovi]MDW6004160.1 MFS transporter [Vibrio mangrovi]SMR99043.1 Putative nucleoside transporter YegT [Vibrio mangrovi]